MPSLSFMEMASSAIILLPASTASGVHSLRTSRPYSDLPIRAPSAMAIGSPIIPVPGMPTPIAFLRILALRCASMRWGLQPSISVALATQSATAMGSVQPIAGITSCLMSAIIDVLSEGVISFMSFVKNVFLCQVQDCDV